MIPSFNYEEAHKLTQSPNPTFKPSAGAPDSAFAEEWRKSGEEVGYSVVDPATHESRVIYRLLIGGVIPRPIAYFNVVTHNPPVISVSFSHSPTRPKDTCLNIKATKTFTVNIISEPFVEAANWCSVDAPYGTEEWYGSGLTKEKSTLISPARVKESAFSLECELFQAIDIRPPGAAQDSLPTATLVLGLIKLIHVRNDVLVQPGASPNSDTSSSDQPREFSVNASKLRAVSRMGGITYGRVGEGFQIPRPNWSEVKDVYEGQ